MECEHQTKLSRCTSTCAYRNLILARVFSLHNQSYIPRVASSLPVALDNATDGKSSAPSCKQITITRRQTYRATDFFSYECNLLSKLQSIFFAYLFSRLSISRKIRAGLSFLLSGKKKNAERHPRAALPSLVREKQSATSSCECFSVYFFSRSLSRAREPTRAPGATTKDEGPLRAPPLFCHRGCNNNRPIDRCELAGRRLEEKKRERRKERSHRRRKRRTRRLERYTGYANVSAAVDASRHLNVADLSIFLVSLSILSRWILVTNQ